MDSADWTLSVLRPWPVDGLVHLNHWQLWQDVQIQELTNSFAAGFLEGKQPKLLMRKYFMKNMLKKILDKDHDEKILMEEQSTFKL